MADRPSVVKLESPLGASDPSIDLRGAQTPASSSSPPLPSPPELSFNIGEELKDTEEEIHTPSPPDLSFSLNDDEDEYEEIVGARSTLTIDDIQGTQHEGALLGAGASDEDTNKWDSHADNEGKASLDSGNMSILSDYSFSKVISSFKNVGSPSRVKANHANQYPEIEYSPTVKSNMLDNGDNHDNLGNEVYMLDHSSPILNKDESFYRLNGAGPTETTSALEEAHRDNILRETCEENNNKENKNNDETNNDNNESSDDNSSKIYNRNYTPEAKNDKSNIYYSNIRNKKMGSFSPKNELGTNFFSNIKNPSLQIAEYDCNNFKIKELPGSSILTVKPPSLNNNHKNVVINETLEFDQRDLLTFSIAESAVDHIDSSAGKSNFETRDSYMTNSVQNEELLRSKRKNYFADNPEIKRPLLGINAKYERSASNSWSIASNPRLFTHPCWDRKCWDILGRFLNLNNEYALKIAASDCLPKVPQDILEIFGNSFDELEISQRLFAAARIKSRKLLKAA
ncbi:hypothetical protein NADFUDRAFT_81004 [Nadsonia fulvescens var. elongata DSM 6958]|uniref:Uncharacterized protein n=1 Tax=Nadsonia fulvescens var. elongata DSM 6958 TaxID=857566 RepID=A0A1E3PRE2_9ASCO|nr:hypothetical protein NADFUDRAFT_81004 [Nadsonia fulvescens var. elongata DSM 6958]